MKKTVIVLSFSLLSTAANAQQSEGSFTANTSANTTPMGAVTKTTAVESRLVAMSTYTYFNGTRQISDSTAQWFSGNNGWDPNPTVRWPWRQYLDINWPWKPNSAMRWSYHSVLQDMVPVHRLILDIDTKKRVTARYFYNWNNNTNAWAQYWSIHYIYTTAGKVGAMMEVQLTPTGWDSLKTINAYNSEGSIKQTVKLLRWDSTGWQNMERISYSYNSNGKIETELFEYGDGGSWKIGQRTTNTYSGNKLDTSLIEYYENSTWQNLILTTLTYNTIGQITDSLQQRWANVSWKDENRYMFSYSSAGDTVTVVHQNYSENLYRTTAAYNNFLQPVFYRFEVWDDVNLQFTTTDGGGDTYYYYEQFTNSVKDLSASANGKMHTYPVPARDYLNLKLDWKNAAAASIALCDMNGRVVKNWNTPSAKNYKTQLDLTGIPAGNYILKVTANADRLVQQLSILK